MPEEMQAFAFAIP
jgi:hypothetical protein